MSVQIRVAQEGEMTVLEAFPNDGVVKKVRVLMDREQAGGLGEILTEAAEIRMVLKGSCVLCGGTPESARQFGHSDDTWMRLDISAGGVPQGHLMLRAPCWESLRDLDGGTTGRTKVER